MTDKNTRGGARPGAGRKAVDPEKKAMTCSVCMTAAEWADLDKIRGDMSRGAFIAKKLKLKKTMES